MPDQAAAMDQGRKAHCAQPFEGHLSKIAFLMSVLERTGQSRLREPAIQLDKLPLVFDVLQIVVNDCDVPNPIFNRFSNHLNRQLRPLLRVLNPPQFSAVSSQGKSEEVADLAEFVPRKTRHAVGAEFKPQVPEPG